MAAGDLDAQVAALTSVQLLDVASLPLLTKHLQQQVASQKYDSRVNSAILRLYQLSPRDTDIEVVETILIKALMTLPEQHFATALALVPALQISRRATVTMLQSMSRSLRMCDFADFWQALEQEAAAPLRRVPGFVESIRAYIADVVSHTYKEVSYDYLQEALQVPDGQAWAAAQDGWTTGPSTATVPENAENKPRPRRFEEQLRLDELTALVRATST